MPDRKLDMPRRDFLRALGAAGLVVGFSPLSRHWIPAAQASGDFDAVPALDGEVRMDDASLASATGDNGFMRNLRPQAVLRPGSVDDVVTMVRWCHARRIAVAARGEAHTIFGQSQVDAGLSIDMRSLTTIHAIGTDEADVDAGVLWSELLDAALDHGRTPPVLTGFIALTVGGTLSVGGVSVRRGCGLQIDHVRRIQVVTGVGDLVWCSETEHSDLFEAVLGGLGQFGIITRAVVELVAAPSRSRSWVLQYVDPAAFFRDFQAMLASDRFHCVHGSVVPPSHPSAIAPAPTAAMVAALGPLAPTLTFFTSTLSPVIGLASSLLSLPPGAWIYQLTVTRHYEPGVEPSDSALLKGL
ncbi:MAG TPA: FAD-binding protein, partial [Nevskiaceae bacterium]|nr:FAD-binding protein [Nevskiaceae bacterium]